MPILVQKYGGSSVADLRRIDAIAAAVVARVATGVQLVVVVSAMGKTTDQLIAQARQLDPEPSRRELDMLVSCGERSTMALLAIAIQRRGLAALSLTGSQSGIITDEQHQAARILAVRPARVQAALDLGQVVIVAGYQGVSRSREITTLGRGGSDTTAVALAAALQAEACEIYSDVAGVYAADPALCPQAQLLPQLSYGLMQGMAAAGARVLSAEAVAFAQRAGIQLEARQTGDASGRHSRISAAAAPPTGVVAVVAAATVTLLQGAVAAVAPTLWPALRQAGGRLMQADAQTALWDRSSVPGNLAAPLARLAAAAGLRAESTGVLTLLGGDLLGLYPEAWQAAWRVAQLTPGPFWLHDGMLRACVPAAELPRLVPRMHDQFVAGGG